MKIIYGSLLYTIIFLKYFLILALLNNVILDSKALTNNGNKKIR
jgi:hypothetical protein